MTKREYMQKMEQALQGYDKEFRREILESYEEHFQTGLKDGRSEEEICQELGAVEGLLGDIQELMGDRDIHTHELEQFTAITEQKEQYNGINKVEMDLAAKDVEISPSADNELHVFIKGGKEKSKYLEEHISGDSYYAREIKMNKSSGGSILDMILSGLSVEHEDITIVVEVPKQLESLTIKTMSGDLTCQDIFARALTMESMSGDIELEQVSTEEGIVKTKSGDFELNGFDSKDLVIKTISGDISWKRSNVNESQVSTISGDVELKEIKANNLTVKTTSGDIELRSTEVSDTNLGSVSGDISGSFFTEKIRAKTTSGDITLTLDRRGRKLIARTQSVSGGCSVYAASEYISNPDPQQYITGEFASISGYIKVR